MMSGTPQALNKYLLKKIILKNQSILCKINNISKLRNHTHRYSSNYGIYEGIVVDKAIISRRDNLRKN